MAGLQQTKPHSNATAKTTQPIHTSPGSAQNPHTPTQSTAAATTQTKPRSNSHYGTEFLRLKAIVLNFVSVRTIKEGSYGLFARSRKTIHAPHGPQKKSVTPHGVQKIPVILFRGAEGSLFPGLFARSRKTIHAPHCPQRKSVTPRGVQKIPVVPFRGAEGSLFPETGCDWCRYWCKIARRVQKVPHAPRGKH
jgi:hypothetical protein